MTLFGFTPPDFSARVDQLVVFFLVFFIFTATLANRLNIPFLTRDGGLLTYSKFAQGVKVGPDLPSRVGMVMLYAPSMVIGCYNLVMIGALTPAAIFSNRGALLSAMVVIHFGKRVLECMFLHKYSGSMPFASSAMISVFYSIISLCATHYATLAEPINANNGMIRSVAVVLFVIGLLGNFYHHYLLATLRKPGEKHYKVPHGGFFDFLGGVATPHYTFELVGWLGVALAAQHLVLVGNLVAMTCYLCDRAVAQSEWNRLALKDQYPKTRKHIFPMVF